MYPIGSHKFGVKINEHSLEKAKTYRYLGIDLQWSLSWNSPIDSSVKKVSVRSSVPRELDFCYHQQSSHPTILWLL